MDIFEKIDKIFDESSKEDKILKEIKEIKALLKIKDETLKSKKDEKEKFFKFVEQFRNEMREDARRGYFPEFEVDGVKLAINERRLLYEKESGRILSKSRAFEVYRKLFRSRIERF